MRIQFQLGAIQRGQGIELLALLAGQEITGRFEKSGVALDVAGGVDKISHPRADRLELIRHPIPVQILDPFGSCRRERGAVFLEPFEQLGDARVVHLVRQAAGEQARDPLLQHTAQQSAHHQPQTQHP